MTIRALGAVLQIEGGPELRALVTAVIATQRRHRSDGIAPSPLLAQLEREARIALSTNGQSDVRVLAPSAASPVDPIGVTELAQMLNCTDRHARRLIRDIGGTRIGSTWTVARGDAQDFVEARNVRNDTSAG